MKRILKKIFKGKARNLTGCGIAVFNDKNEILLQQRADVGLWGLPGGILELGEETSQCAKREVFEETGLKTSNLKLYNVYSGKDMYWKYPDGNEFYFTSIIYITREYEGKITIEYTECRDVKFFDLNNLPEIMSTNIKMIENIVETESNYKHARI